MARRRSSDPETPRPLYSGHLKASVPDAVDSLDTLLPAAAVAWIRTLDSERDPMVIARSLKRAGVSILTGLENMVPLDGLKAALAKGCFTGFDELWFLSIGREQAVVQTDAVLTTDGDHFDGVAPEGLASAMRKSGTCLALGDGDGLNYATLVADIHETLQREFGVSNTTSG